MKIDRYNTKCLFWANVLLWQTCGGWFHSPHELGDDIGAKLSAKMQTSLERILILKLAAIEALY